MIDRVVVYSNVPSNVEVNTGYSNVFITSPAEIGFYTLMEEFEDGQHVCFQWIEEKNEDVRTYVLTNNLLRDFFASDASITKGINSGEITEASLCVNHKVMQVKLQLNADNCTWYENERYFQVVQWLNKYGLNDLCF